MSKLKESVLDFLAPLPCYLCHQEQGFSVCRECVLRAWTETVCRRCGTRLDACKSCAVCAAQFEVELFRCLFAYEAFAPLVQSVKRFGARVTLPVKDTYPGPYWAADSVLPVAVPAQTGTAWLQAGLSMGVGSPLQRKPGKLSQKLKSGGERHRNSLDLFVPGDDSLAVGQSIDLLDDVLSTGQSIRSGLSVLREMGYVARGVLVMSVRNRVRLQPGGEE